MFSRRTGWDRSPNPLGERLEALRRAGRSVIDLTESNPTRCGFEYPEAELLSALADPAVLSYEPDPRGLLSARVAVAEYLADSVAAAAKGAVRGAAAADNESSLMPDAAPTSFGGHAAVAHKKSSRTPGAVPANVAGGCAVTPDDLLLTASTSEAYAYLFKLLCDPGDEVLVPAPSYPLFDFLTGLESVATRSYPLRFDGAWRLEVSEVAAAASERTRAVLVVNPGNPTGAFLKEDELSALESLCAERDWALVCDEVFCDYGTGDPGGRVRTVAGRAIRCLTFSLGGLSKAAALPQLKLGWIALSGPAALRSEAMARLELVADSYLSVNTPVQRALPRLLSAGRLLQEQLRERVARNRAALLAVRPNDAAWSVLPSEGGWSAVVRVPEGPGEEQLCLSLLERGVLVHPGHFFDFPSGAYLVLSLIVPEEAFARGVEALAEALRLQ